jgi:asparagine synthase (glutamine-hydrolysing)
MSGFAGIIHTDGAAPEPSLLQRMAEQLAFRGPDATQIWKRPSVGFCFTLLRTGPSPQADVQPCSLDGKTWLLADVRLDGREELRRKLEQYGEPSAPDPTNEELILRAWRLWAEKSLEALVGDFAFALWDSNAREFWCARDLLGPRPFFYSFVSGQFIFSNTLNVVRIARAVSPELDLQYMGDFLLESWCPDPERTPFRDIRRLPAGHVLRFTNGEIHVRRFATLPIEEPLRFRRNEDYVAEFRSRFEQAVQDRLPHGSAAILMSGGLDSTSVAALASRVQSERAVQNSISAYTVDYSPLFDDEEGRYASLAARHMGIPIEILRGAGSAPFSGLDDLSFQPPEPSAEPFYGLHIAHYRQIAVRARVALSGDGGDDILTGRAWPYLLYLLRRGRLDAIATAFGGHFLSHGSVPPLRAGIRATFRRWMGRVDPELDYPRWLEPDFERRLHLRDRWRELRQPPRLDHPVHPYAYAALTGPYWPNVLEGEDAAWSGVAVETRAPLLDIRLLRFLLRVPPVPWCADKLLLREVMRGLLPEDIRLRRKTPMRGDPLQLHANKNHWRPVLQEGACDAIRMFVNCPMLRATSSPDLGLSLWVDVRPIALYRWLKGVENNEGIQYSRVGETE